MSFQFKQNDDYKVIGSIKLTKYYESKFENASIDVELNDKMGKILVNGEEINFTMEDIENCELYDDNGDYVGAIGTKINLEAPDFKSLKQQRDKIKKSNDKVLASKKQAIISDTIELTNTKSLTKTQKILKKTRQVDQAIVPIIKSTTKVLDSSPWMSNADIDLKDRLIHLLALKDYLFGDLKLLTNAHQQVLLQAVKPVYLLFI